MFGILQSAMLNAQPGSLDTSFSSDGKVTTPFGSSDDYGYSVRLQADGKIVVAGWSDNGANADFALTRYNTDGSLDTTFDSDGKVTTPIGSINDVGYSVAIQSNGKIVVAGCSYNGANNDFVLICYNTDGSLDTTFDYDGKVTTDVGSSDDVGYSVAIQGDGKIVVVGGSYNGANEDVALVRYNTNGSLDSTFDSDGKVTTAIGSSGDVGNSVALQSDGKIVVAGWSYNGTNYVFALTRYNTDGSLDNTFDTDGKVITAIGSSGDRGYSVAIQSDGKIVVTGWSYNGFNWDFAVSRYNTDGSLDNTFDTDGKVTIAIGSSEDGGYSVAIQSDGKIVVAGWSGYGVNCDFALVRYNSDGSLDNTFDTDGKVITAIGSSGDIGYSVAIQSDGKIVVAGWSFNVANYDFAVVRYNNTVLTGIDRSGSEQWGVSVYPNPFTNTTTIEIKSKTQNPKSQIVICDMLGQEVDQQTLNSSRTTLNLNLPGGIYFYKVRNENEVIANGKLVIWSKPLVRTVENNF